MDATEQVSSAREKGAEDNPENEKQVEAENQNRKCTVGAHGLSGLTLAVVEAQLLLVVQGFHALIGRDLLSGCLFTYNGTTNQFTLAF